MNSEEKLIIDFERIKTALPNRADVKPILYNGRTPAIEVKIENPTLTDSEFNMCLDFQRQIIGTENISEFYTEEQGRHWYVFLNKKKVTYLNYPNLSGTSDDIRISYTQGTIKSC